MIKLSRRVLEAVETVVDVAYYGGGTPVKSAEIMERNNIPPRYMESTLQELVRKGILNSTRGPSGGFRLARERSRITLYHVYSLVREMEAVDDPISRFAEEQKSPLGTEVLVPVWEELQEGVLDAMKNITIEDLCNRAKRAGIVSAIAEMREEAADG